MQCPCLHFHFCTTWGGVHFSLQLQFITKGSGGKGGMLLTGFLSLLS